MKKYIVEDHYTGEKYEVTEHTDELGYIHKQPEQEPERKPIDYVKEVKRLHRKEFGNPISDSDKPNINEVKRFHKMINDK